MCFPEYLASMTPLLVRASSDSPEVSVTILPFSLFTRQSPARLLTETLAFWASHSKRTFFGAAILKLTVPDQSLGLSAVFQRQPILQVSPFSLPSIVTSMFSRAVRADSSS